MEILQLLGKLEAQDELVNEVMELVKDDDSIKINEDIKEDFKYLKKLWIELAGMVSIEKLDSVVKEKLDKVKTKVKTTLTLMHQCSKNENEMFSKIDGDEIKFKLPEITVPSFMNNAQDPLAFAHFARAFQAALNNFPGITGRAKLQYLKTLLRGESLALVAGIEDYEVAWHLLQGNFLNKEVIFDKLISEIIDGGQLHNIVETKKYIQTLKFKIEEIQNLGYIIDNKDFASKMLGHIIMRKLPSFVVRELSRLLETNYPDFFQIMSKIDLVIGMLSPKNNDRVQSPKKENKEFKRVSNINSDQIKEVKCKFCKDSKHTTTKCNKYVSLSDRINRLSDLNLCKVCLSANHKSNLCKFKREGFPFQCIICKSKNHISPLCNK